jgi:hypothetical protein
MLKLWALPAERLGVTHNQRLFGLAGIVLADIGGFIIAIYGPGWFKSVFIVLLMITVTVIVVNFTRQ